NLRHRARGLDVTPEHFGIAAKRRNALLDAGAAAVVEADHRGAILHSEVHDLADFLRVGFAQAAAEDGKILAEHIGHAAVDGAPAGDHAIAGDDGFGHAELDRPVGDEHVVFLERARIEQHFEPLARGELALAVLRVDAAPAATQPGVIPALVQGSDDLVHVSPNSPTVLLTV